MVSCHCNHGFFFTTKFPAFGGSGTGAGGTGAVGTTGVGTCEMSCWAGFTIKDDDMVKILYNTGFNYDNDQVSISQ